MIIQFSFQVQWTMQTLIMLCFTFLCNMNVNFNLFDFFTFCAILQFLLLHLGTDKLMCSLMCKIWRCVHLPDWNFFWKTIKFPLIWYIIDQFLLKTYMKNLNLKKCLLSFFAECRMDHLVNYIKWTINVITWLYMYVHVGLLYLCRSGTSPNSWSIYFID